MCPLKIAQVAPLYESVPPRLYGGTERVVSYLTEELVRQGHEVTLFASADSVTRAELVPCWPSSLRLTDGVRDVFAPHALMLEHVYQRAHAFDVVHFHLDYLPFSVMRRLHVPWLTTLHGRLDLPELAPVFKEFRDAPLVSITNAQRTFPARWLGTVYHGLPANDHAWSAKPGEYLAFVGRMDPEKNPAEAIRIAKRAGLPLRLAGKLEAQHQAYFDAHVAPFLGDDVTYLGEVSEAEKRDLMRHALAVLFPIRWPEPFGLVMTEAMACGTPVIAYPYGSVPEVVDDGVTGFVVRTVEDAAAAVARARELDRAVVRVTFEKRFSAERMTRDYVALYEKLVDGERLVLRPGPAPGVRAFERAPATARASARVLP